MSGGAALAQGPVATAYQVRAALVSAWAHARVGSPFAWGESDCAILVAEAYDAMNGTRHADDFRGRWNSAPQAVRFQRRETNVLSWLFERGATKADSPIPGDFIVIPASGFLCGHVCVGRLALSAWPDKGVGFGETEKALAMPGAVILRTA